MWKGSTNDAGTHEHHRRSMTAREWRDHRQSSMSPVRCSARYRARMRTMCPRRPGSQRGPPRSMVQLDCRRACRLLDAVANVIEDRLEEIAGLESRDTGSPIGLQPRWMCRATIFGSSPRLSGNTTTASTRWLARSTTHCVAQSEQSASSRRGICRSTLSQPRPRSPWATRSWRSPRDDADDGIGPRDLHESGFRPVSSTWSMGSVVRSGRRWLSTRRWGPSALRAGPPPAPSLAGQRRSAQEGQPRARREERHRRF